MSSCERRYQGGPPSTKLTKRCNKSAGPLTHVGLSILVETGDSCWSAARQQLLNAFIILAVVSAIG